MGHISRDELVANGGVPSLAKGKFSRLSPGQQASYDKRNTAAIARVLQNRRGNTMNSGLQKLSMSVRRAISYTPIPALAYTAYKGKTDKDAGKNNIGTHSTAHGVIPGAATLLLGTALAGPKAGLGTGLLIGTIGAGAGSAAYGLGRLASNGKKNTKRAKKQ